MAITKEQKQDFSEKLIDFKSNIDQINKESNSIKLKLSQQQNLKPYLFIYLSINSIKIINTCYLINELSLTTLGIKSDNYLNIGRKEIYNAISFMEKAVGADYENSLTENKDLLSKLSEFTAIQRLNYIKGLRIAIDKVIEAFGSNSKWKWSFPEIQFKLAVISKNCLDFMVFEKEKDLENPDYYTRQEHFNLIIELSNLAAQAYRSKFDLSTQDVSDLKKSVELLEMNRKIFQITGELNDIEKTKTLIESFKNKIEEIENAADDPKKKKKKK